MNMSTNEEMMENHLIEWDSDQSLFIEPIYWRTTTPHKGPTKSESNLDMEIPKPYMLETSFDFPQLH